MPGLNVTYEESVAWILSAQNLGMKLGLDTMRRVASILDNPEDDLEFIHVAGTNGKGSTCAFMESIARAHGLRSGLYTSPHLVDIRERFQVDRVPIGKEDFARHAAQLRSAVAGLEPHPTYFELVTSLALLFFREAGVDLVVWETGMGGRLDATNIVVPRAAVITSIGIDHSRWLGHTPALIAGEKAGIFKAGVPAVTCAQLPEVAEVLAKRAELLGIPLRVVEPLPEHTPLGLAGQHQLTNAALAVAGLEAAGFSLDAGRTARALEGTQWAGRMQIVEQYMLDGAHNPDGMRALVGEWERRFARRKTPVIFGALSDKDTSGLICEVARIAKRLYLVPVQSSRSATPQALAQVAAEAAPDVPLEIASTLEEAMRGALAARGDRDLDVPVLVTGSLFLVGEALARLGWQAGG